MDNLYSKDGKIIISGEKNTNGIIEPFTNSNIVSYTNPLYTGLQNSKQAIDFSLGTSHMITNTDLLNGWTNNGYSFWTTYGNEVHVHLNIRYGNTGALNSVICYIPVVVKTVSFIYNSFPNSTGVNGAVALSKRDSTSSQVYINSDVLNPNTASINVDVFGLIA